MSGLIGLHGLQGVSGLTGSSYLIKDEFSSDRAAGAVNGTLAEPGQGTRVVVDTENKLSLSGGKLLMAPKTVPALGDPGLWYDGQASQVGLAMLATVRMDADNVNVQLGWDTNQSGAVAGRGIQFYQGNIRLLDTSLKGQTAYYQALCDYRVIIVQRSIGFLALAQGGNMLPWSFLGLGVSDVTATLYPAVVNQDANPQCDDVWVIELAGDFATDYGSAFIYEAAPAAPYTATGLSDGRLTMTWTPGAGETLEISFRRTDDDNRWLVRCDQAAGTIRLYKRQAAVETEYDAGRTQTWNVGTAYNVDVDFRGHVLITFVNNAKKNGYEHATNVDFNETATGVAVAGFANVVNLALWPAVFSNVDSMLPAQYVRQPPPYLGTGTNAAAALTIPTSDADPNVVHPGVIDAGSGGWNGYRYWMVMSPFPDAARENPEILASADGETWAVPAGLVNPIDPTPGSGNNSDPDLLLAQDDKLYCYWRWADAVNGKIKVRSSSDGVNWSAASDLISVLTNQCLSPSVIWDGTQYVLWLVDTTTTWGANVVKRYTAAAPGGPWTLVDVCTVPPSLHQDVWHIDVVLHNDIYYMLCCVADRDTTGTNGELYMATSYDGIYWQVAETACLSKGGAGTWDASRIYRATLVPIGGGNFTIWYSGQDVGGNNRIGTTTIG